MEINDKKNEYSECMNQYKVSDQTCLQGYIRPRPVHRVINYINHMCQNVVVKWSGKQMFLIELWDNEMCVLNYDLWSGLLF